MWCEQRVASGACTETAWTPALRCCGGGAIHENQQQQEEQQQQQQEWGEEQVHSSPTYLPKYNEDTRQR